MALSCLKTLDHLNMRTLTTHPLNILIPRDTTHGIDGWDNNYIQKQSGNNCAPTSFAVGMSILIGHEIPYETIKNYFLTPSVNLGVVPKQQAAFANAFDHRVSVTYSQGDRNALLDNLRNNYPTVVTITIPNLSQYAHALLVIGYDPATDEFIFFDPAYGDTLREKDFKDRWGAGKDTFNDRWLNQPKFLIDSGSMVTLRETSTVIMPGMGDGGGGGGRAPGLMNCMQ